MNDHRSSRTTRRLFGVYFFWISIIGSAFAQSSLDSGLVAHWPFCGNADDVTGNEYNGLVNGATLTTDRFGLPNNAYQFNGINTATNTFHRAIFADGNLIGQSIVPLAGGGFHILANETSGPGDIDPVFIRTDSLGNMTGSKKIGNTLNNTLKYHTATSDGGFICIGNTNQSSSGPEDIYVVKINAQDNVVWSKRIGTTSGDVGQHILELANGDFVLSGFMYNGGPVNPTDVLLIRINSLGNFVWSRRYAVNAGNNTFKVVRDLDGGFLLSGFSGSGTYDGLVFKVDSTGLNVLWSRQFGLPALGDLALATYPLGNNEYIVGGVARGYSTAGDLDYAVIKFNSAGTVIWAKQYGGTGVDNINDFIHLDDGNFLIAGETNSFGGAKEILLMKIDTAGNKIWSRKMGANFDDGFGATLGRVAELNDGGFIISGITRLTTGTLNRGYLIKTDCEGMSDCRTADVNVLVNNFSPALSSPVVNVTAPVLSFTNNVEQLPSSYTSSTDLCPENCNPNNVDFHKTFASATYNLKIGSFYQQKNIEGYCIEGWTTNKSMFQIPMPLRILTDKSFNIIESKRIIYPSNNTRFQNSIESSDNSLITLGTILQSQGFNSFLSKRDSTQAVQWSKVYQVSPPFWENNGRKFISIEDGSFVFAGEYKQNIVGAHRDLFLTKVDSFGNPQFSKAIPLNQDFIFQDIVRLNSGYLILGYTNSGLGLSVLVDNNGSLIWSKQISSNGLIRLVKAQILGENTNLIACTIGNQSGIIKVDSAGNMVMGRSYTTTGASLSFNSLFRLKDGNYLICGTIAFSITADCFLLKIDPDGNIIWSKSYELPGYNLSFQLQNNSFFEDANGELVFCVEGSIPNSQSSLFFTVKADCDGNSSCNSSNLLLSTAPFSPQIAAISAIDSNLSIIVTPLLSSDSSITIIDSTKCTSCPVTAGFLLNSGAICLGNQIIATNTSLNSVTNQWFVNGILVSTDTNLVLNSSIFGPGTINIQLHAIGDLCSSTTSRSVIIGSPPEVSQKVYSICPGNSVIPSIQNTNSVIWSPNTEISCTNCINPIISPTISRYYIFTASNGVGCVVNDSIYIEVKPFPNTGISQSSLTICAKDTIQLGGPPLPNHIYNWSPSTWLNSSPNVANPLLIGFNLSQADSIYKLTLQVTDTVSGCTNSDTLQVIVKPLPIADVGPNLVFVCLNDSVQIGALPEPGRQYLWFPPAGISNPTISNPFYVHDGTILSDHKILRVTNTTSGCQEFDTVLIFALNPPDVNAGPDIAICSGDTAQFLVTSNAISFLWTSGTGLSSTTIQNPYVTHINPTQTVQSYTYFLLGTSIFGCKNTDTVTVFVEPLPVANAGPDQEVCSKDTIQLGVSTLPDRTYLWTPSTGLSSNTISNPLFTLTNPTQSNQAYTFTLRVTDTQSGCINFDTVSITVKPLPITEAGPDQEMCSKDTIQLGVATVADRLYQWTPAIGLSNPSISNPLFTLVNPTQLDSFIVFVLQVTNTQNTCTDFDTVQIRLKPLPITEVGPDQEVCSKDTIQLGVASTANRVYQWTPGLGLSNPAVSDPLFTLLNPTQSDSFLVFVLQVTNTQNTCTDFDTVQIKLKPLPIPNAGPDKEVCSADTVELGASPEPDRSYLWSPPDGVIGLTLANPGFSRLNVTPLDTVYTLILRVTNDTNNCVDYDTVQVNVNGRVQTGITGAVSICPNETGIQYWVPYQDSVTYLWSVSGGTIVTNPPVGDTISVDWGPTNPNALVQVIPYNRNNCAGDTVILPVVINLQLDTETPNGDTTLCSADRIATYHVFNVPTRTYSWFINGGTILSGQGSSQISVEWTTDKDSITYGTLYVLESSITPTDTCFGYSDTILVTLYPSPDSTLSVDGIDELCAFSEDVPYSLLSNLLGSSFNWSIIPSNTGQIINGQGTDSIRINWGGTPVNQTVNTTVRVIETSVFGCVGEPIEFDVLINPLPVVETGADTATCSGATIQVGDVPVSNYAYSWNTSAGLNDSTFANPLLTLFNYTVSPYTATYILEVTNTITTCTDWDTLRVTIYPEPDSTLPVIGLSSICAGVQLSYTLGSLLPGSSFNWSINPPSAGIIMGGQGANVLTVEWVDFAPMVLTFASLSVLETSMFGCTRAVIDTAISIYPVPKTLLLASDTIVCPEVISGNRYQVLGLSNSTYQWFVNRGAVVSGQGTDSVTVNWLPFNAGSPIGLRVVETSDFGCMGDTLGYNLVFDATGLEILVVGTQEENHRDTRLEFTISRNSFYQDSIRVYRFADGEGESLIEVYPQTANLHEDTELNTPSKVYYYVLKGINRCGIEIESGIHNTILLRGYPVENRSESVLFWNGYKGWPNGVNRYEIWRKIDAEAGFAKYETTSDTFAILPNGQDAFMHQYRILAVNGDGSLDSWSNILQLNFENKIWMANTITDNGDGLNDVLKIENVHLYPVNKLSIFNRYGKLVFEQSNYKNDWSGNELPAGPYYVFFQTFSPNREYKGWVQIMR